MACAALSSYRYQQTEQIFLSGDGMDRVRSRQHEKFSICGLHLHNVWDNGGTHGDDGLGDLPSAGAMDRLVPLWSLSIYPRQFRVCQACLGTKISTAPSAPYKDVGQTFVRIEMCNQFSVWVGKKVNCFCISAILRWVRSVASLRSQLQRLANTRK